MSWSRSTGPTHHAWDPLAHLRVTTTAHAEAARLVDAVAHRWAAGRWLATGGGGYDAYRVVSAHVGADLAGRGAPLAGRVDAGRLARPLGRRGGSLRDAGMPTTFLDAPNAGQPVGHQQAAADEESLRTLERVRRVAVPALVREAEDRGWWTPSLTWAGRQVHGSAAAGTGGRAGRRAADDAAGRRPGASNRSPPRSSRGSGSPRARSRRSIPSTPSPSSGRAAADGARVVGAIDGDALVGVAVAVPVSSGGSAEALLAVGVAPAYRRRWARSALSGVSPPTVRPGSR